MTLREQAESIISSLDLIEKLGQFGEAHVVGSVAFGTTVKPDLDIQIYTEGHYENVFPAIEELLESLGFTDIHGRRLRKSKKFLVLSKKEVEGTIWDLDVTLTQPNTNHVKDSYRFYLDYLPKMTDEKRELIIKFKQEFRDYKISGDNPAYYIYLGVLDENITTVDAMQEYLDKRKNK